ncbi:MAG: zf-HC2 domain-containing protein [Intrasporangium sp.]|uniref:zf-HC2 domain-containing protein n=1 Tax=Intrasporangium sp. TaxID=1925024 RepID=UPI0026493D86|nr:zf-HC2 domain-containing protein [Intrasporangium sp.]MDN5796787.1 zf-HC2 domain-containing protein [Intrasporangium sp.]
MNSLIGEPHVLLGAYVLGALSDEDQVAFGSHLQCCRQCREELAEVAGLPRLLDLVDPAVVDALARS